ncbi:GTP pyrophosphokinase [Roseomonas sp. USHLN139]|uniref:GTP pyrophosphokinase n=1 Tax=Roseomonas sp. USHLN139 TaxID=3081298 RepID=UPI003B013B3A
MSDRETQLLELWRKERPMYEAWGACVSQTLTDAISAEVDPAELDLFFRIPLKPRTKGENSLLTKAFRRGKPYEDPYNDIEDKVGVRIVVLFSEEIRTVERAICACEKWNFVKARDFEQERDIRPFEFDYQSLHYIVRAKGKNFFAEEEILEGTACEIQIRTILQHAYSELTHDTIYKPSIKAEPGVKRAAAKSMALIEATDDYFTEVRARILSAQEPSRKISSSLDDMYKIFVGLLPDKSPLNTILIDYYKNFWGEEGSSDILDFLKSKPFLSDRIKERFPNDLLYRQPASILIYWSIKQAPRAVSLDGPLSESELAPFYSDLGISFPNSRI